MCSSFIGRVAYTGLYLVLLLYAGLCSVVLQDSWPRVACIQCHCRMAGLGWLEFSSTGWLAQAGFNNTRSLKNFYFTPGI